MSFVLRWGEAMKNRKPVQYLYVLNNDIFYNVDYYSIEFTSMVLHHFMIDEKYTLIIRIVGNSQD